MSKNYLAWHYCNIADNATIGRGTTIGSYTEIGPKVVIGYNCRIQAYCFIPEGVKIGNYVFLGPRVTFTNVKKPDARTKVKSYLETIVEDCVTIGANATILPGIRIGKEAFIGAGAVVTKDVKPYTTVVGNPARPLNEQ